MLLLFTMDASALDDAALFEKAFQAVSDYRREKTERYRHRKDKILSLGAGLLLDFGLKRLGLCEQQMQYAVGENGKPFFQNAPELCFNLSHSGSRVLTAFSDSAVGCDVEQIKRVNLQLAKRFFHVQEQAALHNQADEAQKQELFLRLWTLKESFLKCTGFGLRLPLDSFFIHAEEQPITLSWRGGKQPYHFAAFSQISGYQISCCYTVDVPTPQLEDIGLQDVLS